MSDFERQVHMTPAWDKRHDDPTKNYGVHGVDLYMAIIGKEGAVEFQLYTGWDLPHVEEEKKKDWPLRTWQTIGGPGPACVAFYYKEKKREWLHEMEECKYMEGVCYGDVGYNIGYTVYAALLTGGDEAVWEELERLYHDVIQGDM